MSKFKIDHLEKEVENFLGEGLYRHSLRTAEYASRIAAIHGLSADRAYIAGLLHDLGKRLSLEEQSSIVGKLNGATSNSVSGTDPSLHAVASAHLASEIFGIRDRSVISAIRKHTTGAVRMSAFEKLIYLADSLEPGRNFESIDKYRDILRRDINEAFDRFYFFSHANLIASGKDIHPVSKKIINRINRSTLKA